MMASSSGNSTGTSATTTTTTILKTSSSEEDLQLAMDERKRKRMQSNRESARRSRMRKQKHLDELMAQANQLKRENAQVLETMNLTTQHFLNVETDNSVLRAQMAELTNRLDSLNNMILFLNSSSSSSSSSSAAAVHGGGGVEVLDQIAPGTDMLLGNSNWNLGFGINHQPIMDYQHLFGY